MSRHSKLKSIDVLQAGDTLILHGRPDHLRRLHGSQHLRIEPSVSAAELVCSNLPVAEGIVADGSPVPGATPEDSYCRAFYRHRHQHPGRSHGGPGGIDGAVALGVANTLGMSPPS